jgi:hypothetical protein
LIDRRFLDPNERKKQSRKKGAGQSRGAFILDECLLAMTHDKFLALA